jgi:hypothetical protein
MTENKIPFRGLVVAPPWARLIVQGDKTWELRKQSVSLRGEFAVIAKGTGTIIGTAELVECRGPLSLRELMDHRALACESTQEIADDVKNGYVYAWVLANAREFDPPVSYRHPNGAVVWVKLPPATP